MRRAFLSVVLSSWCLSACQDAPVDRSDASTPEEDASSPQSRRDARTSERFDAGPPPPPGCGLPSAAFCEDFEAEPSAPSGRTGELDASRWSVGRMMPQLPTEPAGAFWIGPSDPIADCRSDVDGRALLPDSDTVVCDPQPAITSRHALSAVASQIYGLHSFRARRPFDFGGRTGTIAFDADLTSDPLLGWVAIAVTESPTPTPSYAQYEYSTGPERGILLSFSAGCEGGKPGVAIDRGARLFEDYVESVVGKSNDCVRTEPGRLNHVEVHLSRTHVEVLVSEPSPDGRTFGEMRSILSTDIDLPFERGYVNFTIHNHATSRYGDEGIGPFHSYNVRWDNFAFDGPVLADTSEHSAADALTPSDDGVYIGYPVSETAALHFAGVEAGATRARLSFTSWYPFFDGDPPGFTLRFRWNGGEWRERALRPSEYTAATLEDQQGALNQTFELPVSDLREGDNTLEVSSNIESSGYPPAIANVDLHLER
jgi:hypothetical protein